MLNELSIYHVFLGDNSMVNDNIVVGKTVVDESK